MRLASLLFVSAFGLVAPASASIPAGRGLSDLNTLRTAAGMVGVDFVPALNIGCDNHNAYREANGPADPHDEVQGRPRYSDEGRTAAQTSVLATGELLPADAWAQAPFHRASLLQPRLRLSGYAGSYGFTCLKVFGSAPDGRRVIDDSLPARTSSLTLYPWPADGGRDVPVRGIARGLESPDPYAVMPESVDRAGPMITVSVNGPWSSSLSPNALVGAASLIADGTDKPIPLTICDSACRHGDNLDGGFGLFVHAPLREATWHTIRASGVVRSDGLDHPFDAWWRFQTVRMAPESSLTLGGRRLVARTRSAQPLAVTLTRLPAGPPQSLTLATGARHVLGFGSWRACFTQAGDEQFLGVAEPVCAEHDVLAPAGLRLSALRRAGRYVRFVVRASRFALGARAVLRASGVRRVLRLRSSQVVRVRAPRTGRLRVTVSLARRVLRDGTPVAPARVTRSLR